MVLQSLPLTAILVALRLYTRLCIATSFGADDVCMLAAVVSTIGCSVIAILSFVNNIWTRRIGCAIRQNLSWLKYQISIEVLFGPACSLTKTSLFIVIIRIISAGNSVLRVMAITVMIVIAAEDDIFSTIVINTCR